jgi:hypothetical protein
VFGRRGDLIEAINALVNWRCIGSANSIFGHPNLTLAL